MSEELATGRNLKGERLQREEACQGVSVVGELASQKTDKFLPPQVKPKPSTSQAKPSFSKPPPPAKKPKQKGKDLAGQVVSEDNVVRSQATPSTPDRNTTSSSPPKKSPPVVKKKPPKKPPPQANSEGEKTIQTSTTESSLEHSSTNPIHKMNETASSVETQTRANATPQITKAPPPIRAKPKGKKPPVPHPRKIPPHSVPAAKDVIVLSEPDKNGDKVVDHMEPEVHHEHHTEQEREAEMSPQLEIPQGTPLLEGVASHPAKPQDTSPSPELLQEVPLHNEISHNMSPQPEPLEEQPLQVEMELRMSPGRRGPPEAVPEPTVHHEPPVEVPPAFTSPTNTSKKGPVSTEGANNDVNLAFLEELDILSCIQDLESQIDQALGMTTKSEPDLNEYSELIHSLQTLDTGDQEITSPLP
jgi:hypothetical protein